MTPSVDDSRKPPGIVVHPQIQDRRSFLIHDHHGHRVRPERDHAGDNGDPYGKWLENAVGTLSTPGDLQCTFCDRHHHSRRNAWAYVLDRRKIQQAEPGRELTPLVRYRGRKRALPTISSGDPFSTPRSPWSVRMALPALVNMETIQLLRVRGLIALGFYRIPAFFLPRGKETYPRRSSNGRLSRMLPWL